MCYAMNVDFDHTYGGYSRGWQYLGIAWPVIGLICFLSCLVLCTTEEPFEHDIKTAFSEDKIANGISQKTSAGVNGKPIESVTGKEEGGPKEDKEGDFN